MGLHYNDILNDRGLESLYSLYRTSPLNPGNFSKVKKVKYQSDTVAGLFECLHDRRMIYVVAIDVVDLVQDVVETQSAVYLRHAVRRQLRDENTRVVAVHGVVGSAGDAEAERGARRRPFELDLFVDPVVFVVGDEARWLLKNEEK